MSSVLNAAHADPLYRQLAKKLEAAIASGTLGEGDRMPSVRTLSLQHGVSISTAIAVYRELENMRLVEARPKSGYFVVPRGKPLRAMTQSAKTSGITPPAAPSTPMVIGPASFVHISQQTDAMMSLSQSSCRIRLDTSGFTGVYPVQKVQRLMNTVARRQPGLLVQEAAAAGHPALRAELAKRALLMGVQLSPDDILITNGVTEALNLALRAVAKPGDTIAVESPTFFGILQILESLGMKALEIPTHARDGLSIEALGLAIHQAQAQGQPLKALVVMSNFHNPQGSLMPDDNKARLVRLMHNHHIPIIEDDWSGDLYFTEGRPQSLKAWDSANQVILCSSATKPIAPGLRIGWMAGGQWQPQLERLKYTTSIANIALPQVTIAEFIKTGGYEHHLRKLRGLFHTQTRRMAAAIERYFPEGTQFVTPQGGALLWVELPQGASGQLMSSRELFEMARAEGIGIGPGVLFSNSQRFGHYIRIYCGGVWDFDLDATIQKLGILVRALQARS